MKIGLFIPCYVDQFYPEVGIATLQVLQKLGADVEYPLDQTCCGQPMANAGFAVYSEGSEKVFVKNFEKYDYVVAPSGSCVLHIKDHIHYPALSGKVFEFCEFLVDKLKVNQLDVRFPYKVGLHASCHGLRGLRLASATELHQPAYNKVKQLLQLVKDIELIDLSRKDECCGFGGTFAVSEEAISVQMGIDRLKDHHMHGAEVITGADMSCLMHLSGLLQRQKSHMKVMHVAEILNHSG